MVEASAASGISEEDLLAAYEDGKSEVGCRATNGTYVEYVEIIGDKIIIKIDESIGWVSFIGDDYTNISYREGDTKTVFVYDVAEDCLFGEYSITPGVDTITYSLTDEYDFATIQEYVNVDRETLEMWGDMGVGTGIGFEVENGILKELCTMFS